MRRRCLFCVAVSLIGTSASAAAAAEKVKIEEQVREVAAILETETPTVQKGKRPKFTLTLINRGSRELVLVKPNDGSACGWRTPIITWHVDGKVGAESGARCGNINPLKPDEVVTLKPGERLKVGQWLGASSLSDSGAYEMSLRYVHDPKLEWKGIPLGEHDKGALEKIKASRRIEAESNAVEITVKE